MNNRYSKAIAKAGAGVVTSPTVSLVACGSCRSDRITVCNVANCYQQAVCKDCKQTGNSMPTWEEAVSDWNAKMQEQPHD